MNPMQYKLKNNYFNRSKIFLYVLCSYILIASNSCASSNAIVYDHNTKLSPMQLQKDFILLQKILEQEHPSTYWYSKKEEMDVVFENAKNKFKDSLSELQFKTAISAAISKIKCGHTSVRSSKGFEKWINNANISYFPFGMRLYNDTMVATYNLYRKDTLIPRGSIIKSINGVDSKKIIDSLYNILSTDGDSNNFKNIRISNNFPYYYLCAFDSAKIYNVTYLDSAGKLQSIQMTDFKRPPPDTTRRIRRIPETTNKWSKKQLKILKRQQVRRLSLDTINNTAVLTINSFSGALQRKFYHKTFKELGKKGIDNLVIDVRNNGGGVIANSSLLSAYIANHKFKVADSVFAIKKISKFNRNIKYRFWYGISMLLLTHKKEDGFVHFGWFSKKWVKPKKQNHYNGKVYVITGGYSFSATTLFIHTIQNQNNVTTVGEETGGGAYGNSAIYIPDLILPNSKIRVRMPIFRLVVNANAINTGKGIMPKFYVPPTLALLKNGGDNKMDKVLELIKEKNN
jgi:C-terminal processing protease CtpA/Prc